MPPFPLLFLTDDEHMLFRRLTSLLSSPSSTCSHPSTPPQSPARRTSALRTSTQTCTDSPRFHTCSCFAMKSLPSCPRRGSHSFDGVLTLEDRNPECEPEDLPKPESNADQRRGCARPRQASPLPHPPPPPPPLPPNASSTGHGSRRNDM